MDLWSMLEERVKQQGLRVKERLELLESIKAGHKPGEISMEDRMDEIVRRVKKAADRLKEAMGE